jgi:alkylated DNA repair dioxygenase AlkB
MAEPTLDPILAMVNHLDQGPLAELEAVLSVHLAPLVDLAEERRSSLGYLSEILPEPQGQRVWVPRKRYEESKPEGALTSETLVKRHGSWAEACQAAAALKGSDLGRRPWSNPARGRRQPRKYTAEEVLRAVKKCAVSLGRFPTSRIYYDWVSRERRRARESGAPPPRLPLQASVERHFPGWGALIQAYREWA